MYEMPDTIIETIPLVVADMTSNGFEITFGPPGRAYYLAKAYAIWGANGGAASTMILRKFTGTDARVTADTGETIVTLTEPLAMSSGLLVPQPFVFLTTAIAGRHRRFKPLERLVGVMAGTVSPLDDVRIQLKWTATR